MIKKPVSDLAQALIEGHNIGHGGCVRGRQLVQKQTCPCLQRVEARVYRREALFIRGIVNYL